MKKILVLVFSWVLFCLCLGYSAVTTVSVSSFAASVSITADASGDMSTALYLIDGAGISNSTTSVKWYGIEADTEWKAAAAVIVVTCTYNAANWAIRLYTDNTASDAMPQWNDPENDPAGLLAYDAPVSTSTTRLEMCWRITGDTTNTYDILERDDNNELYDSTLGDTYYCFVRVKDKVNSDFGTDDSSTIWNSDTGIHHANGNNYGLEGSPNYVYIGADFENSTTPRVYQTNKLILELYTE